MGMRRRLAAAGVLGINRRNAEYVLRCNERRLYPLVDDKLRTKGLALEAGMAVPELYGVITHQHEVRDLVETVAGRDEFVIKPAHGSGGNGIVVVRGRRGELFRLASGRLVSAEYLEHHVENMLSGLYSLGSHRDRAMIEYCVQSDAVFDPISYQGVPDLRVIVYRGFPTMAMVRLPTHQSDGKANLHQGAVGVGIDLQTGTTVGGVQGNHPIQRHPDTGEEVAGVLVPSWESVLELSARCLELTGLGYLGVDVVLDRDLGPLILELNARPGLNIQIANGCGLATRLRQVDRDGDPELPAAERARLSARMFAVERAA